MDIKIYNRFMYEVLFVTPPPLHLCMKYGTIKKVEQETHDRFTGVQITCIVLYSMGLQKVCLHNVMIGKNKM